MRNLWLLGAALPVICFASDAEPLGEVIVTATRTATPVAHLAVPVTVISRDELEHSAPLDVADALAGHVGVEVARTGGPGQPASLFIRGTNSNHSVVLVDGVRINPGTLGGAALQNILPDSIERIEIVRGARSALWGTDAIGGVVNIITRGGSARQPTAMVAAGSYDTRRAAVDAGTALGADAGIGASLARQTSAGFAPLANDPRRRGYRNTSGNLAGYFKPTDAWRIELSGWNSAGVSEYLGYDDNFNFGPLSAALHNAAWALTATQATPQYRWQTRLSRATDDLDQREFNDFAHTRRDSAESLLTVPLPQQQLMAGVEFAREATASASFGTRYDVTTRSQRYFAQDQITAGDNDILLAVGRTQHQDFGGHSSWNAEWNRRLNQRWRVSAAVGSAFHAPDSTARYGFGGNPALRPERSAQAEAGLHWQPSAAQALALNVFDTRVRDLIVLELTDPLTFTYEAHNVARARIRGVELNWNATVGAWRFDASASLQDPRNDTTGERLARRAHSHFDLRAAWEQGRFRASAAVLVSGNREDVSFPANVLLPGYTLVNGSFGYQLGRDWSLQARVDNLLDRRYQLVYGYHTPRRNFLLTARYRRH